MKQYNNLEELLEAVNRIKDSLTAMSGIAKEMTGYNLTSEASQLNNLIVLTTEDLGDIKVKAAGLSMEVEIVRLEGVNNLVEALLEASK